MNKFELKNVKGTFDFMPNEQIVRNQIIDILKSVFELYGFLPLETATLCYYDLLASKYAGGSEILKEVYTLEDQGKRKLGLRYDLTVPFSKSIALSKDLQLPFKRYEIGKVFRDGPVKLGRNREFYQCDVDVCGISSLTAEAEFFSMTIESFKKLGIDIEIKYNNRLILSGLIKECGIEENLVNKVILIVDKLEKISKKELYQELKDININEETIDKLFSYFAMNIDEIISEFSMSENLKQGIIEITELNSYIKSMDLEGNCSFKPFLARGLDIYTGTVWEIFDKQQRITSSLGGGGRYDKIISNFIDDGNTYPTVGMSFGLEPIYAILKDTNNFSKKTYELYVYPFEMSPLILKIGQTLRQNNIKTIIELNKRKLKKGLDFANKNSIPYVLIIGEDELKEEIYTLKNMETGEQFKMSLDEVVEKVKNEN